MKILFLATWFPYPPDNGSKLRVYHLLRSLAKSHEITLVSFAFDTARPSNTGALHSWCRDIHVLPLNPFAVNRAGTLHTFLSLRPVASRSIPAMSQLVNDVLRTQTFDAVIASTEMTAEYALQAPPNVVEILEEHNSMTRWRQERFKEQQAPLPKLRYWVSWQKRRYYERRYYPQFDLVTMVSAEDERTTKELARGERPHVAVVPNGVDCVHNQPGLALTMPNTLVYNGALTYSANYDAMRWFLAQVYPRIKAKVPDVSLTITGSTKGVDLGNLALDDSVRLTGFVDDVRLPVAKAAVCVVPIREGGGTRLKILEAMALGTPVVATPKGSEGLALVDGEHLLLADDPQRFANHTVALLGDANRCARLATHARRLVKLHYDWEQIGRRFVELMEETVKSRLEISAFKLSNI